MYFSKKSAVALFIQHPDPTCLACPAGGRPVQTQDRPVRQRAQTKFFPIVRPVPPQRNPVDARGLLGGIRTGTAYPGGPSQGLSPTSDTAHFFFSFRL